MAKIIVELNRVSLAKVLMMAEDWGMKVDKAELEEDEETGTFVYWVTLIVPDDVPDQRYDFVFHGSEYKLKEWSDV